MKTCECGCGQEVAKGKRFITRHNFKKGHPYGKRFGVDGYVSNQKGKNHKNYNGGITFCKHRSRWEVLLRNKSYIPFSRIVMENHLGRLLEDSEVVHHIDGDSTNDVFDNLMLFESQSEHIKYHRKTSSPEKERRRNKKISKALSGRKTPEEVRRKISFTVKKHWEDGVYNKK
jgi:hypothetical protein